MNNLKSRILDLSGGFNGFFVAVERDQAPCGESFSNIRRECPPRPKVPST